MPCGSQQCMKEGGREDRARLLPMKEQEAKKFHLSIRKNTFTVRVDKNQDRLSREVVECSSLEIMQWTALSKQL